MTSPLSVTAKNAIRSLLKEHNINARGMDDAELLAEQAGLQGEEIIITELPNVPARRIAATPAPKQIELPAPTLAVKKKVEHIKPVEIDATKSPVECDDITRAEYHRTLINTMEMNVRIMKRLLDDLDNEGDK